MAADPKLPFSIRLVLRSLSAFVLANVLLLYVPMGPFSLAAIILIAAATMLLDHRNSLPLAGSLALMTIVLEVAVRAGIGGSALNPYFRPHEMLALQRTYRPNQFVEMDVPHGDLLAIDSTLPRTMAQKRHERFKTDSFGSRNEQDYAGEKLIVIGDSFTVGVETYLVSRLRETHRVPAFNVSFASIGPLIYAEKVQWSREHLAQDACIALFMFEGNDFQEVDATELATRNRIPGGVQKIARGYVRGLRGSSEWSKVFYGLTARVTDRRRQRNYEQQRAAQPPPRRGVLQESEKAFIANVGGKPMAFSRGYANVVRRQSLDDHGFVRDQIRAAKPDVMFFIPEKYRIYGPLLDENPETEFPTKQLDYLRSIGDELDVPVIDLTAPLQDRSREILQRGELTWWRDDTHWNGNGEAVAAEVLLRELALSKNANCANALTVR